jgi:putative Mg2+ transporter-C (MgtC) family protein
MASAASLWNTGAIGIAVAFDRFEIAVALSLLNFLTLHLLGRIRKSVNRFRAEDLQDDQD